MPKGTAMYWKHDENQDGGDDITMTINEFLVDYVTDDLYIHEIVIYHKNRFEKNIEVPTLKCPGTTCDMSCHHKSVDGLDKQSGTSC